MRCAAALDIDGVDAINAESSCFATAEHRKILRVARPQRGVWMSRLLRPLWRPTATLPAVALSGVAACLAATPAEAPFMTENDAAMTKMMAAMEIKPSGDVDKDFVAMMAPHHQGAIDMAQAELRYGHNEQLRRLAQEIIVTQQQEIAAMKLALGQPLPPSLPAPDQISKEP
jgi:hypothetical protein